MLTCLWQIDDGSSHERSKDPTLVGKLVMPTLLDTHSWRLRDITDITNRESSSCHILDSQFVTASL